MDNGKTCDFVVAKKELDPCLDYINYGYDVEDLPLSDRRAGSTLFISFLKTAQKLAIIESFDESQIDDIFGEPWKM